MHSDEENICDTYDESPSICDPAKIITEETETNQASDVARKNRWFILEPPVFLAFLSMFLSGAVYQNKIIYQTCKVIYSYNETDCKPLLGIRNETQDAESIETEIQPYVAKILMARSLLESIIPAFVSLFVGPWSDKFGRRPILLSTFFGYFLGYIILTALAFLSTKIIVSPWVFLLSSVPSVFCGGTCALITGIYCYISDVASEKGRAFRMVLNESSLCAGMMFGSIASSYIYVATNIVTVFAISAALMLFALIYVYVFVVESIRDIHTGSKVREFFRFDLVKELFRTCFERRQLHDRTIIWLTMFTLTIVIFTMEGESTVTYLFLRRKFEWDLKDYTLFNACRIIFQIAGSVVGMVILKKLMGFSIVSMTLISLGSSVLEETVRATAMWSWQMYLGMSLGALRGVLGPMARAILSHVTPASDIGKIFALTTSLESISPLLSAPLYTFVYNSTIVQFPGAFNFISAAMFLLCYVLISIVFGIQKTFANTETYRAIGS